MKAEEETKAKMGERLVEETNNMVQMNKMLQKMTEVFDDDLFVGEDFDLDSMMKGVWGDIFGEEEEKVEDLEDMSKAFRNLFGKNWDFEEEKVEDKAEKKEEE